MNNETVMTRMVFVANKPNEHNEIYSAEVLKDAVNRYREEYVNTGTAFGVIKTEKDADFISHGATYSHKCISIQFNEEMNMVWATVEFLKNDSSYSPTDILSTMRLNGAAFTLIPEGSYTFTENDQGYRLIDFLTLKAINIKLVPRRLF